MHKEQKNRTKEHSQETDGNSTYWSPAVVDTEQGNTQIAITQRDVLYEYFVFPAGEVNFQYDYINRGIYRE